MASRLLKVRTTHECLRGHLATSVHREHCPVMDVRNPELIFPPGYSSKGKGKGKGKGTSATIGVLRSFIVLFVVDSAGVAMGVGALGGLG